MVESEIISNYVDENRYKTNPISIFRHKTKLAKWLNCGWLSVSYIGNKHVLIWSKEPQLSIDSDYVSMTVDVRNEQVVDVLISKNGRIRKSVADFMYIKIEELEDIITQYF